MHGTSAKLSTHKHPFGHAHEMAQDKFTMGDLYKRSGYRVKRAKLYSDLLDVPPARIPNTSSSHPLSLLRSLPQEILLHVVELLAPEAYLAIKFVSRRMNAATKCQDGAPMKKLEDIFDCRSYGAVMAILEAGLSDGVKLDKLTCRGCGKVFGVWDGEKGFGNEHFDRALRRRQCIPCHAKSKPETVFKVNKDHFVKCFRCKEITPWHDAIQPRSLNDPYEIGGALIKSIERFLGFSTWGDGEDDRAFLWICRDCLRPVLKRAARHVDLETKYDPDSEGSYHEFDIFEDMWPVDWQSEGAPESES